MDALSQPRRLTHDALVTPVRTVESAAALLMALGRVSRDAALGARTQDLAARLVGEELRDARFEVAVREWATLLGSRFAPRADAPRPALSNAATPMAGRPVMGPSSSGLASDTSPY